MTTAEQKKNLKSFVKAWKDRGYEKGETQQFWLQLLRAIGYDYVDSVLFEKPLKSRGFPDVWLREVNVMVEQKSLGVDLDKPEPRQGEMKTPFKQVLDYAEDVPINEQPSYLMTCNFGTFRIYDRAKWHKSELEQHPFEFSLEELAEHPDYLNCITDPNNTRLEKEKQVSIKAGEQIGKLYDMLREGYLDPDSEESMHALNVLCVRLVFCLYCEDADLFEKDAFLQYLKGTAPEDVRSKLKRLFKALDTEKAFRDPYDTGCKPFPYVNGGLFAEDVEIPNFSQQALDFLINEVSAPIDWSQISPTIFGGIFESTLNPETRRSGGMHYTSPENIHKVIDPLFLDDLKEEYRAIRDDEDLTPRQKRNRYKKFHQKLCSLTFFDPACGSGNFLTETYLCLRKLEDKVLDELQFGQLQWSGTEEEETGERISLSQFHGIEINDFAVSVAETALYISRLKANNDTMMLLDLDSGDLPLKESAHIVHGNALSLAWDDVVPAEKCNYIMGNPPFAGHQYRTSTQQEEMKMVFKEVARAGKLDYVACWYMLACKYIKETNIKVAFVSPNAITQGEQVEPLWNTLFSSGITIIFARRTFKWENEATDQALVYCVVIGFGYGCKSKKMLISENNSIGYPQNINGYLLDAPNVYIQSRGKPLFGVNNIMSKGSQPTDGGGLILSESEKDELILKYPVTQNYIRRFMSSDDFLKDKKRYCLWLVGVDKSEYSDIPEINARLQKVKESRLHSPTASVKKDAETPFLFSQIRQPSTTFLAVPEVTSGRRKYLPIGFLSPEIIASNKLYLIPNASLYMFGVMSSLFHNAWMRIVASKYGPSYSYAPAVYNNFVWPNASDVDKRNIENCAKRVLEIRNHYVDSNLAKMYDGISPLPDDPSVADKKKYALKEYDELLTAHKALDDAVESAYGVSFQGDEEKIVAHLFKLYEEATKKEKDDKTAKKNRSALGSNTKTSKTPVRVKVKVKSGGVE